MSSLPRVTLATPNDEAELTRLCALAESPFDVKGELARSYAKLWLSRAPGAQGAERAAGFLLAWLVVDEVHLLDVLVEPAERRRGHASALIQALLAHVKPLEFRVVLLEVRRDNQAAQALYRRFGFEQVGERPNYYADGEDALLLQLELERVK